jgi:uncharacterized DUF497 family protein
MARWDERKRQSNLAKHGVDFALADRFELDTALVEEDRDSSGEQRFRSIGYIGDVLYFLAFKIEVDGNLRVISLRRATPKERRRYAEEE